MNKYAGIGYQENLEGQIIDACAKRDVECTIEFTGGPGHGTELSRQSIGQGFQQVVAVGGDGTLNEVAQGLLHSGIPMGIIPRGSGNGLARHLGISVKVPQALNQLFESSVLSMDTFTVNGKLSLNVSGIGFDGHVTNLFGVRSTRGLLGYVVLTIKEFLKFNEFGFTLTANGETLRRTAFIVAIANSSQYGNNARIAPGASVCDGLLHVNMMRKVPLFRIDFVFSFFRGKLDQSKFCDIIESDSIALNASQPIAYHVDGEPCGLCDTFLIQLTPGSLPVLVPERRIPFRNNKF